MTMTSKFQLQWASKAIFLLCLSVNAHSQGIPVIDVANLAQAVTQVQSWANQFKQMEQTINSQRDQLKSVTGYRGLANALNQLPKSALHPQFTVLMAATRTPEQATELASQQIQSLHASTQMRSTLIQSLMELAAQTQDPKALGEVQARIAAEQAAIQNETKEVALVDQTLKLQQEMMYQANRKRIVDSLSSSRK